MPSIRSSVSVVAVTTLGLSALLAAQVVPQARDPQLAQPTERRIPVGSASISGTVISSDTGRPVSGARVSVSGQVTINPGAAAAAAGSRGSAPQPVVIVAGQRGVAGGVPGGLGSVQGLSRSVITDASGQFTFPRLPAGQFTVSASQSQFLSATYGQRRFNGPGTQIQLTDGQQMTLKVPMVRGGVIMGMVVGPDGEPQRNAQVRGWRYDMSMGFRRLQGTGFANTDDRGIYRMSGLQPGDYLVSATPNSSDLFNVVNSTQSDLVERAIVSGQVLPPTAPGFPPTVSVPVPPQPAPGQFSPSPAYLPTYAPNAVAPSAATVVTVAGNEERVGVDILVRLTQASTVQGTISTPLDANVTVQLTLASDDQTIDAPQTNSARVEANGKFVFRAVPPGKYVVFAQTVVAQNLNMVNGQVVQPAQPPTLTDAQKMWGRVPVTVAGEPTIDVSVALQSSRSISGVVVFEMKQPPDLARLRMSVSINPALSPQPIYFGQQLQAQVEPDGRFTVNGVPPGRYTFRVGGGLTKSAVVAGEDTLDVPLEFTAERDVTDAVLTVTDQSSELTGTLTDSGGKPAVDYMILVAPTDSRYWVPGSRRITMTRPGPDGRYTIRSLPSGSYSVAAVIDLEPGAQFDPAFLRTLARASVPVTILEGGKVTQDLRVK